MAPRMRKRDKKRDKARTEAAVKKRRELYVDVVISNEGKRGKGRRQRVRCCLPQSRRVCELIEALKDEKGCGAEEKGS